MARTIEIAIQEGGTIKLPATQVKSLEKAPIGTKITIKGVQYTKAIPKAIRPARVVLSRQLRPTTRAVEPIFEPKLERFVPAKVIEVDKQKVATPSIELFEIKRPALQEVKEQKAYEVLSRGGVLGESLAKEFDLPQRLVQAPLEEKRKTIFREAFGRPTIREKAIELEETNILTKQFIGRTTIAFAETGRDIGGAIAQPTVFAKETKKFAQELKDPKKLKEFGSDIIKFAQEKPALFAGELVGSAVFFTLTAAALRGGAKATLPAIAITKALRFRKLMRAGKLAGAYKTTKPSKVFILPFALKKGKKF